MSFEVEALEKQYVRAVWCLVIPETGHTIASPVVNFSGQTWKFIFQTKICPKTAADLWIINAVKVPGSRFQKFLLTVHVKGKNSNNLFMNCAVVTSIEYEIFRNSQLQFFNAYPKVECFRNILTFIFKFYDAVGDYEHCENSKRKHKSIQTSPYMDDSLSFANLSRDLCKLMEDASNPDVELRCGECTVPAHRLILGARSEVLRTMLQSDMREGREGVVQIVDMEPEVLEIFVRYLYTGTLPGISVDNALALYEASDKYQVEPLRGPCGEFLVENITVENACSILALASVHSDTDLKDRVMCYVLENKVPKRFKDWPKFCEDYPKQAMEVLNRAYMLT